MRGEGTANHRMAQEWRGDGVHLHCLGSPPQRSPCLLELLRRNSVGSRSDDRLSKLYIWFVQRDNPPLGALDPHFLWRLEAHRRHFC